MNMRGRLHQDGKERPECALSVWLARRELSCIVMLISECFVNRASVSHVGFVCLSASYAIKVTPVVVISVPSPQTDDSSIHHLCDHQQSPTRLARVLELRVGAIQRDLRRLSATRPINPQIHTRFIIIAIYRHVGSYSSR